MGNRPNDDINHAKNILKWSAFPGTSRHHWGLMWILIVWKRPIGNQKKV